MTTLRPLRETYPVVWFDTQHPCGCVARCGFAEAQTAIALIFDADGEELYDVSWVNVHTHEAEQCVRDAEGALTLNEDRTDVVKRLVRGVRICCPHGEVK
jgi:hypothetical protein